MRYWTWGEVKEKIQNDMDLQEEPDIVSEPELMGYVNDAIDAAEQHFIGLGDYFLSVEDISIVSGTRDYDLPDDIYASKIRKVLCDDDYEVRRMRDLKNVAAFAEATASDYVYMIINNPGARPKIRLYPTPTASGTLAVYYTRNAARINEDDGDDQEIDVPEAMGYIFAHIKRDIYEKEKSPMFSYYDGKVKEQESLLQKSLAQMIDDEDDTISPDIDMYKDMI